MLAIVVTMLLVLLVAAATVVYVAFPHRGAETPGASWLGDAMHRAVDALPTLDDSESRR